MLTTGMPSLRPLYHFYHFAPTALPWYGGHFPEDPFHEPAPSRRPLSSDEQNRQHLAPNQPVYVGIMCGKSYNGRQGKN